MKTFPMACLLICICAVQGCASVDKGQRKYETITIDPHRDVEGAKRLSRKADRELLKGNVIKAEKLLKEALIADVRHGPVHNNLGQIYFDREDYYLAAWEYEYAVKLMPDRPEPYNNLGLVYEAVERYFDARESYETALSLSPENIEIASNLTRVRIRSGEQSDEIAVMLRDITFKNSDPVWRDWALDILHTQYRDHCLVNHQYEEVPLYKSDYSPSTNPQLDDFVERRSGPEIQMPELAPQPAGIDDVESETPTDLFPSNPAIPGKILLESPSK